MKSKNLTLILICLFFIPYIYFYGVEVFPTWRIFNILFVLLCLTYFKKIKYENIPNDFVILSFIFSIYILFQIVYLVLDNRISFYEPFFFISLVFLLLFAIFLYILLAYKTSITINTLLFSIQISVAYQIFQFLAFLLGFNDLVVIFSQIGVAKIALVYKIVGNLLAAPGFLSESGQTALYLGSMFSILLLFQHYFIFKTPKYVYGVIFIGIIITLSGGAFIELIFIGLTVLFMNLNKTKPSHFLIIFLTILLIWIYFSINNDYYNLILERVESVFTGKSSRMQGAETILEYFWDSNIIFGIAPKSGRFMDADQNMLLPMLLTDHGILGTSIILVIFLLPILSGLFNHKRILFIIPYSGFLIHLFLAYGTYLWSYLWIVYIFTLFGINVKIQKEILIENKSNPT